MCSSGFSCPGSQTLVVSFVPQIPVVIAVMRGAVRCVREAGKCLTGAFGFSNVAVTSQCNALH